MVETMQTQFMQHFRGVINEMGLLRQRFTPQAVSCPCGVGGVAPGGRAAVRWRVSRQRGVWRCRRCMAWAWCRVGVSRQCTLGHVSAR